MSTYSSFFSSGLLAARTPPRARANTMDSDLSDTWDDSDYPPSQPSSPIPLPDDTLMDIDLSEVLKTRPAPDTRRSVTPTPQSHQTTPVPSPQGPKTLSREGRPRLRKRRSSLTQGTSPMHTIRSPTRAAGNAFNFQIHLPAVARARSRSGSLHGESIASFAGVGMATEETSLIGRLRSGSCSNIHPQALNAPSRPVFRPRRIGRRILSMPIPAAAPPPTLPLPALPLSPLEVSTQHNVWLPESNIPFDFNTNGTKSPQLSSARARGLSVSKSSLDGDHNKIDEEMKEN